MQTIIVVCVKWQLTLRFLSLSGDSSGMFGQLARSEDIWLDYLNDSLQQTSNSFCRRRLYFKGIRLFDVLPVIYKKISCLKINLSRRWRWDNFDSNSLICKSCFLSTKILWEFKKKIRNCDSCFFAVGRDWGV